MSNEEQNDKLRKVAWSDLFPWLILARAFRIAIQLRLLFLGAVGMFFTIAGWALLGLVFSGNGEVQRQTEGYQGYPWLAVTRELGNKPRGLEMNPTPEPLKPELISSLKQLKEAKEATGPGQRSLMKRESMPGWGTFAGWEGPFWTAWQPLWSTWEHLSRPLRNVFSWKTGDFGWTGWVTFSFLCGLWAVAVWAFFGGAVSRAASVELATGDRAKLFRSLNFAASKWTSYFAAPLIPLVGALVIALPVAFAGWFLWLGGIFTFVAALGWPLVLLAGFLMALLLLGLVFGWPLFWGNLSTEGVDSFDAVGRTYDYVYHRPLNYLFYAIVAALIGALGWLVVANFFEGIIGVSYWAASWGATEAEIDLIKVGSTRLGTVETWGSWLIRFWVQGVKFLGVGFLYSYIWVAGSAIYLLLRRDVDATEMDEVLPEEEAEPQPAPLPEVKTDEAGAPVVGDQPPPQPEAPKEGEQPPKEGDKPRGKVWSVLDQGEKPPAKEGEQPQPPS